MDRVLAEVLAILKFVSFYLLPITRKNGIVISGGHNSKNDLLIL